MDNSGSGNNCLKYKQTSQLKVTIIKELKDIR